MYEGNKINFVTQYNYLGTIIDNHLNLNENFILTHFMSLISFDTPGKHQKTSNFVILSGGINKD